MKRLAWIVAVLALGIAGRAAGGEAITNYGSANIPGYADGGGGFGFTPLSNLSVTSLGYWANGLASYNSGTVQVSLWDSTGDLLGTALITGAQPTYNQSYYQTVSLVTLDAGVTYYLGAAEPGSDLWLGSANNTGDFSVSPDLTYLGYAIGANIWDGLQPDSTSYLLAGPDFQYTVVVPEPGTLALAGLGVVALALGARKLRR